MFWMCLPRRIRRGLARCRRGQVRPRLCHPSLEVLEGRVVPTTGLVSWWKGEGNAADSVSGNNGTLLGEATFAAGKVGQAFKLDGNGDYITVPDAPSLDITTAVTVEAWIKPDTLDFPNPSYPWAAIVAKSDWQGSGGPVRNYGLWLEEGTGSDVGKARLQLSYVNGAGDEVSRYTGYTAFSVTDFTHVAGVIDPGSGRMELYVNGDLVTSSTTNGPLVANNAPLTIGFSDPGYDLYFPGLIDEVRVYNRALSAAEIQASADGSMVSVFTVVSTADSGIGSLRRAINDANANAGPDTIVFNIPTSDPGYVDVDSHLPGGDAAPDAFVIKPLSALPALTDATGGTTIDGRTQTAFTGDTNPFGPEIVLDGSLQASGSGLLLFNNGNRMTEIVVHSFPQAGIVISGGQDNWVFGTYVGTDPTGTVARGNKGRAGIRIVGGARFNLIGTNGDGVDDTAEGNVSSGNLQVGILIDGIGSDHNVVAGNYVGTDATGTQALGNGTGPNAGISIESGASFNRVGTNGDGTADAAERNIISGNLGRGVSIKNLGTTGNIVAGNFVGTDVTGTVALGNTGTGVAIDFGGSGGPGATDNRIGTNGDGVHDDAERNVISGNGLEGVGIGGAGTDRNVVAGNYIGVDVTGVVALGNGSAGVLIASGGRENRIGTNGDGVVDEAERNVISGNGAGVVLVGAHDNVVAGNFIGTDATGILPIGNGGFGVQIRAGSQSNRLGTNGDGVADATERNLIAASGGRGVEIRDVGSDHNMVAGNYIGTDVTGKVALGNLGFTAVRITFGAQFNVIGTDGSNDAFNANEGNLISGNNGAGVTIDAVGSDQNVVAGNFIGTNVTGSVALPNAGIAAVRIADGAAHNRIGTNGDSVADAAERNIISGNNTVGVLIEDPGDDQNVVAGNFIGTDVTGTVALGNARQGILITGGQFNRIGTNADGVADAAERNIISGNLGEGVAFSYLNAVNNVVAGNFIGTNVTGTAALGNGGIAGVASFGASANRIGTNGDGLFDDVERNLISGNLRDGVLLYGTVDFASSEDNVVAGNYIGTDVTGTVAVPNGWHGVELFDQARHNRVGTNGDGVADEAERNLISGNTLSGVVFGGGASENLLAGNYIGTDHTGTAPLGNDDNGVAVGTGSNANQIGGLGALGNIIAFNGTSGVVVIDPVPAAPEEPSPPTPITGITIRGNSIHSNGGLGIDLGGTFSRDPALSDGAVIVGDGVTPNDAGDVDTGPNNRQNFPILSLVEAGSTTHVAGTLNSTPDTTFTIDLYANTAADPSGFGEGERYLGSTTVTTDASGNANFDVVLATPTSVGEFITATATDPAGNTSEFSGDGSGGLAASPTFVLVIDDPQTDFIDVIVADNAPVDTPTKLGPTTHADASCLSGVILFLGGVGAFPITVTTAVSKPVLGGAEILLSSLVVSWGAGSLVIRTTDANFNLPTQPGVNCLVSPIGGVTTGQVTFKEEVDLANNTFATGPAPIIYTPGLQGPFGPGAFADVRSTAIEFANANRFSLTKTVTVMHCGAGVTGFGAGGLVGPLGSADDRKSSNVALDPSVLAVAEETIVRGTSHLPIPINGKPGRAPNSVNRASNDVIPVAFLTPADFDAMRVVANSVVFASTQVVHWTWEDVDNDHDVDLILHDINEDGVLDSNRKQVEVSLTGLTTDGELFRGSDLGDLFLTGRTLKELLEELEAEGQI